MISSEKEALSRVLLSPKEAKVLYRSKRSWKIKNLWGEENEEEEEEKDRERNHRNNLKKYTHVHT